MRADNARNFANLPGPRNLKQEIEAVDHVGFDLNALIRAKTSLWNGKIADFIRSEDRFLRASRVVIGLPRDFKEAVKFSFRQHRWLICLQDGLESAFDLGPAKKIFLIERGDARQRFRPVQF